MTNNDFLRRLRYALNYNDTKMSNIFKLAGYNFKREDVIDILKRKEDEGFRKISNTELISFLNALITMCRGENDKGEFVDNISKNNLNNLILKKLKIALKLRSEDMQEIFKLGGHEISKSELSAVFRVETHKNYKEAGDKYIRVFLKGLTLKNRGENN